MTKALLAVVGAAETDDMGEIPNLSELGLNANAALNALEDAGLGPKDIDGVATAGQSPVVLADYLGITPEWIDGTGVGGCSFLMHVRHAAAAIAAGLCQTVLVAHGESGRSRIANAGFPWPPNPGTLMGQFEAPFGAVSSPTMFTVPVLRFLHDHGMTTVDLARVVSIQREWAARNPRAMYKDQMTPQEVLEARMIAYPFTRPMCCPLTDGGGALILTAPERARDFDTKPVYVIGSGESTEAPLISQMTDFKSSRAFRLSAQRAFDSAGIAKADVDHLMVYDAFAHKPLYALQDLGFCAPGEAGDFIKDRHTAPGGTLPMNTNGGGLCYMHSGMYGMYALQESVRQVRGIAPAQVPEAKISVAHGVGGMFAAASTIVFTNQEV